MASSPVMVIVLSVTVVSIPSPAAKVIVSPSVTGSAVPFSASIVNAVPDEDLAKVGAAHRALGL